MEPFHKEGSVCPLLSTAWLFLNSMAVSQGGGVLGLKAIFILKEGILFPPLSNSFKPPPAQEKFLEPYNKDTFRITASFSECVSYVNAISEKLPSVLHFNPALKTCKTETEKDTLKLHRVSAVFHFYLGIKKPLFFKFRLILNHLVLNWKREGKWWLLRIYSTQIHPRWGPLYQSANPWKTGAVWDRPQQGSVKGHCKGLHKKPGCLPPPGHRPVFTVGLHQFLFTPFCFLAPW